MSLKHLKEIASKQSDLNLLPPNMKLVAESIAYLSSDDALETIERDPYWPKWNGPWWHMLLLWEIGAACSIPESCTSKMLEVLNKHYLKFFPFTEEEIPEGKDPYRHILCHCAMGSIEQVLFACGVNVENELPWFRPWYSKYQLPDGGLNCDEAAYTRETPKSSVVSTLPTLEAVLYCSPHGYKKEELAFLERGANYLIERRLCRQQSSGKIMDEAWQCLCFPRFYHYDVLRGLNFLLDWSLKTKNKLPLTAIEETVILIDKQFPQGKLDVERNACANSKTWLQSGSNDEWTREPASTFPLFDNVGTPGNSSLCLSQRWSSAKVALLSLIGEGLISSVKLL